MYHKVSKNLFNHLKRELPLHGGTTFNMGKISIDVEGKDGLGGLIEEWFGQWAKSKNYVIFDPKKSGNSQEFPDYYVGNNQDGLLEVKSFDADGSANFDIANFESYCESLSYNPCRINTDYLIFGYKLDGSKLKIENLWLKKIWEITCPSEKWPLKTQTKRKVIYNIRPASWYSKNARFDVFSNKDDFVNALYLTQKQYLNLVSSHEELRYKKATGI